MGKKTGICFWCGKRLVDAVKHKPVKGVVRTIDGSDRKMHEVCGRDFDEFNKSTRGTSPIEQGGEAE